jgi:hypothetical protein
VFAVVHFSLRETSAFIPPAKVGHNKYSVQDEKKVLDFVHPNPLTSTGSHSERGIMQTEVWSTLREKQLQLNLNLLDNFLWGGIREIFVLHK